MRKQTKYIGTVAFMAGIPSIPTPFVKSWTDFITYNARHIDGEIFYFTPTTSLHFQARNQIVEHMEGDWVLMLDTDNKFPPDLLHRMLARFEKHDLDVLTGLYQFKSKPHSPVLFKWRGDGITERIIDFAEVVEMDQFNYVEVECAGAGCLLVRDRVFVRILEELKENPFDHLPPLGEDFSFFKRLQRLNIQAVCDPAIHVEHLRWVGTTPPQYQTTDYFV